MVDITVIILTKNEEKNIKKCINSVKSFAKRIVVVDSYSEDNTKKICLENNIDFYENTFINHSKQFNWALENTSISTEWVMKVDADEEISKELQSEIQERLDRLDSNISGIEIKMKLIFMGRWIKHGGVYPIYFVRIFRFRNAVMEEREMDEHIKIEQGNIIRFKYPFIHDDKKTLSDFINKHNWYSNKEISIYEESLNKFNDEIESKLFGTQAERKRWIKKYIFKNVPLFLRAKVYYIYRYYFRFGFLDGKEGKIFHFMQGYWYRFLIDAKIYEYISKDEK
ncbi:glycosyltransferase family 2 protein [Clostridium perfringens]|uniref:glycosyltransferase family 2 protein n=1 Tax=Clostridium perfringens TaxID=1502 RepID=UPI001C841759|nr:glycosyltransferase family 2 protein [Clostridium perfringens]ELC8389848.1 glycosyltransferase family 2 protein [Clostridium perfringens]